MKKKILLLTTIMFFSVWINAETISYWRFEQGTNGTRHTGDYDNWYLDSSGKTNNLSAEADEDNPYSTNNIPFTEVPLTAETNLLAATFDGNMALTTCGTYSGPPPINNYYFTNGFTVECMVKYFDFNFAVVVGNDGRPTGNGDPTFSLKHRNQPGKPLQFTFFDGATNNHKLYSSSFIDTGVWYRVAAVCDGSNAYLYIKHPGFEYQLEATETNITGGALYHSDDYWTVGRGKWGDNYDSWLNGCVDEVRISDTALNVSEFLDVNISYPSINITNESTTVTYDIDQYSIGGTNNANVVGTMVWSNQLTDISENFPAALSWTIPNIALAVGANVIVVTGTNSLGHISSDSVTITRKDNRGTESNPYTIAEARALTAGTTQYWAQGYIVGGRYGNFDAPFVNDYGISCADSVAETNVNNCLQVILDSGAGFRNLWGVQSNPKNIGKRIKFHGFRDDYEGKSSFEGVDQIIEVYPESTVAYWRFEKGTNGTRHIGNHDNWYLDSSGNLNNLSAEADEDNPYSTNDLPFNVVPLTGVTNLLASSFNQMALATCGTNGEQVAINDHYFTNGFTVECMVKYQNFGYQVAVGNDGRPSLNGDPLFALKFRDQTNHPLQLAFFDGAGVIHKLYSERSITTGVWYSVAAVCDNSNAYLYIKTWEEYVYQLEATETNVIGGLYHEVANWTVGRGKWADNPDSYLNGCVDEVRISDVALVETQFLGYEEIPEPSFFLFLICQFLFINYLRKSRF